MGVKAAHDVSPMKGGIVQRSTLTFTSSRGLLTLKTFSVLLYVPLRPVTDSMVAVSMAGPAAEAACIHAASTTTVRGKKVMESPPEDGRTINASFLRPPSRQAAVVVLAAASRAPTACHWRFWKNASMYFAAAAPKSIWYECSYMSITRIGSVATGPCA